MKFFFKKKQKIFLFKPRSQNRLTYRPESGDFFICTGIYFSSSAGCPCL
jgi:hypothetical protein